ncbi:phenylalanyl-tRNA synthetase beta subunit [Lyngbya sp. PCC 8106]|nr:phenylalanyl-tRNA synthetase beta subunit [Lyngbya sp. PCC 8106]
MLPVGKAQPTVAHDQFLESLMMSA